MASIVSQIEPEVIRWGISPDLAVALPVSSPAFALLLSASEGGPRRRRAERAATSMRVTMLLCDFAQVSNGKLYIMGGGWSITGPGPVQMGLAVKMEIPWDRANERQHFVLDLLNEDGQPALVTLPTGEQQQLRIDGDFEAGRPTGLKAGTPLDMAIAVNLPPVQLEADRRYTWRIHIGEETREEWQLGFTTRPAK